MSHSRQDQFKIDAHKLHYHVPRVHDWLENKVIFPIYLEISPSGTCNHRCLFCAMDYMGYQNRFLDFKFLAPRLSEMGLLGVKSVMYAGEGEPLLHKDIRRIIEHTRQSGMDVAVTTNGVWLDSDLSEKILCDVEWIKVSINAGTEETYAKIHRAKKSDFNRVINNLSEAVRVREQYGYSCTLGMQLVLLPENQGEVLTLAEIARDIGVDYFVIKPYSQHLKSKTHRYSSIRYSEFQWLSDELSRFNAHKLNIIFRDNAMKKWDIAQHRYTHCLALPFWAYLDSGGNIWGCSTFLGDEQFRYGNIYDNSFQDIWEGKEREHILRQVEQETDTSMCRINCRMDEVNKYLWELRHPPAHVNFI